MIKKIDLQLSDQCNRRCSWCPMLQNSKNEIMKVSIILKLTHILNTYPQLFSKDVKLTLSRYNEPLLHPQLMKQYLKILRKSKVKFKFTVNTNGDFIKNIDLPSYLQDIDLFIINDYNNSTDLQAKIKLMESLRSYTFLENIQEIPEENLLRFYYNNTEIEYIYNKPQIMNTRDRGGTLQYTQKLNWVNKNEVPRTSCDVIGNILSIDVNGNVYPCCDTCDLIPKHHVMCCGNILKDDFLTIYQNLIHTQPQENICAYCTTHLDTVI